MDMMFETYEETINGITVVRDKFDEWIDNNKHHFFSITNTKEAKIVLLGDVSVGKTSIASRYCKNSFNEHHINTIGGAYQQQNIVLNNGAKMKLQSVIKGIKIV